MANFNKITGKYECDVCKPEFIPILNDKNCRTPEIAGLNSICREAINIGTESNPIYTCTSCKSFYNVNVTDHRGVHDCYEGINDLILCQSAIKLENGTIQCTKCLGNFRFIFSELYNKNICNEKCEDDGFKKNYWCYKCDDKYVGNPGCDASKGCSYESQNDKLICNECRDGYFEYTPGQCFLCKFGDPPCTKCHYNTTRDKFECDECMDGFMINKVTKKCERITCDEHPEVTPGCIICSDKLDEYKNEGKCESCREGYFKTKEGTCIHCNAQKNGGPACELCGYEVDDEGNETNDIVCKHCPNGFLTSDQKCYKCEDELEYGCSNCTLQVNNITKTEKLVCTNCYENYILSNHSHCIHYNSYAKKIPFCLYQENNLNKYIINSSNEFNEENMNASYPNEDEFNFDLDDMNNNTVNNPKYKYDIHSDCKECKDGYILMNNTCLSLDITNCSLLSIIPLDYSNLGIKDFYNILQKYSDCEKLGSYSKYVKIDYYYEVIEQVKVIYINNDSYYYDEPYYNNNTNYNDTKPYYNNNTKPNNNNDTNENLPNYNNSTNDTDANTSNNSNNNKTIDNDYNSTFTNNTRILEENNYTNITNEINNSSIINNTNHTNNNNSIDNFNIESTELINDDNITWFETDFYDDKESDEENNYTDIIETFEIKTVKYKLNSSKIIKERKTDLLENGQIISIISKGYLYLSNLGTGGELAPESLRKCKRADYNEINDTYICTECVEGYVIDQDTNICKQSIKVSMNLRPGFSNCYVHNIGTYSNPIYSCYSCYGWNNILVTSDTGAKFCVEKKGELEGCTRVSANTTFLNDVYNCSDCQIGYISYYNKFFEKVICQDIHSEPDKIRNLDSTIFEGVENVTAINGKCENDKLFTPDGIHCYACNNRTVGMVGCKGTCKFDLKKNISLKCEDGMCKTGYIEKTRGVCEPCETINQGCIECHYEENYLNGYYGFKRKRRFSCDQCDNGCLISEDGTCHHCSTLGFDNCKNCGVDAKHDNEIVCVECQPGYFVNNEGKCIQCRENSIRGNDNTCISCDDVESGGIEGCYQCHNVDNKPQCTECDNGFILLENNYTCLRISSNVELEELPHCQMVYLLDNNHFICSKCDDSYILLKENNDRIRCYSTKFVPTLNPQYCEIFENLGSEDKPKFSCSQCKYSATDDIFDTKGILTRVTYQENNTAYCERRGQYSSLENSTEATMIIEEDGTLKLNCTECIEDNILYYHKDTDLNICKYKYFEKQCVIQYCKTCVPGNNYFCAECLPSNYEVSQLTGGCVRKMEKDPAVYFKDIFRFKMNQYKQIGGRMLHGPFLSLRGLTNSQINTGHAFLVLLSFTLHNRRNLGNRHLQEKESIKTYCQIVESVDESEESNLVDFDCIGDLGDIEEEEEKVFEENYELSSIEESPESTNNNNENNNISESRNNIWGQSNLFDLVSNTDLKQIKNKVKTDFELKSFQDLAKFNLDEVKNFISQDYHFDVKLNGKLNKQFPETSLDIKLNMSQIKDKSFDCKFNIKADFNADIKCEFNLEEYKNNFKEFSFKVTEIKNDNDQPIYLSRINEVKFIHEDKKDDNNYTVAIVCSVIAAVVVIAGIVGGVLYYKKRKKSLIQVNTEDINYNVKKNEIEIPGSKSNRILN